MFPKFQCTSCGKFIPTAQGLKAHCTRLHPSLPVTPPITALPQSEPPIARQQTSDAIRPATQLAEDLDSLTTLLTSGPPIKLFRRIPKGSRGPAAAALAEAIDTCTGVNSPASWIPLFKFATSCFKLPDTQDPKVSLATTINRNVVAFRQEEPHSLGAPHRPGHVITHHTTHPIQSGHHHALFSPKQVEAKIADGDIRGAIRTLCSDDSIAPNDSNTLEALTLLHPLRDYASPTPQPASAAPFNISPESIKRAIASFPSGSAGAIDGLRPQHLKDLTSHSAGAAGTHLISSLGNLASLMLSGRVPSTICPLLYGAKLLAIKKKSGGLRPIAVGNSLRRLTAKISGAYITSKLAPLLQPIQLGFGTRGGAEAAAHSIRRFTSFPHDSPKVLLKLDFKNAFNSIRRDTMLKEVEKTIPELLPFLGQCYADESQLFFNQHRIRSSTGIQQGDPLGPALFCLVVQPLATSLLSELNVWYLDDASLGGPAEVVLEDLKRVIQGSTPLGLSLNTNKCELIHLSGTQQEKELITNEFESTAPNMITPKRDNLYILGAPLNDDSITSAISSKVDNLKTMSSRLPSLSAHYAYYVLKNALAIPKLIYTLRCSPAWKAEDLLLVYDQILANTLEKVTNISLTEDAKTQMTFPVPEGGLGLKSAQDTAVPAFMASASSVALLSQLILPAPVAQHQDPAFSEGLSLWQTNSGGCPIPTDRTSTQTAWEKGPRDISKAALHERATDLPDKARLLGVNTRESGAFLNAVPSPSLGTFLDDNTFRVALSLRLGLAICQPFRCACGIEVDASGRHGLSCKNGQGRLTRHATINDIIKRGLSSAGIPSSLEPPSLSPTSNIRPDGITLTPWSCGKSLIWDFTCVDSLAPSYIHSSAGAPLTAATTAEAKKTTKYASLQPSYIFNPIAAECLGSFGPAGLKFLRNVGEKISATTGEKRATEFFFQRLSIGIQRGNAASILGSIPRDAALEDPLEHEDDFK